MENDPIKKPDKITYEALWKAIIRPPRDIYEEDDLGSPIFTINEKTYVRKDYELLDFQGYLLKVSMIEPSPNERPSEIMPCVIYLHANASSRIEGLHIRKYLLKRNINLCVFDFEGSGVSEGEYISLGYHEKNQVRNIVDFVEKYPGVGKIGLWGRSMGAATSLIYTSIDKRIKATVADSPFCDFRRLAKEMVQKMIKVPGFLLEGAISIIGHSVYKKNGMDVSAIKAIDAVKSCNVPVIFIHAADDELVPFQHSEDLIKNYCGRIKELRMVNGGHNGKRPNTLMEYVGDFFKKYLIDDENDEDKDDENDESKDDEKLNNINEDKDNKIEDSGNSIEEKMTEITNEDNK